MTDQHRMDWLVRVTRELSRFDDTGDILNRILLEMRAETCADAGTIFLVEGGELVFAYTHNDTLFPVETAHKYAYAEARLPLSSQSIAGCCAVTGQVIRVDDVRRLPPDAPFEFNDSFDRTTGYRTVSVLAMPLMGRGNNLLGVVQLINSMGPGGPRPFTDDMENWLILLGVQAVAALERGFLAREMLLRLQKMAGFSDPRETAPHAERVGAIAAEIYQRWAEMHGVPLDERRAFRARLRLAAMVHDIGKIAIPQEILKKPGKLTPDEFEIMKTHCIEGARIFERGGPDLGGMARDITLHHHQRWDGGGYTGSAEVPLLAGEAIPLAARITAVADVFDALVSSRCYKAAWPWERAMTVIGEEAGTHFDPEVVQAFMDVDELVRRIFGIYRDAV